MKFRPVLLIAAVFLLAHPALADKKFGPAQIRIVSVEEENVDLLLNPKELTIDKPVPWDKGSKSDGDEPALEFTSAEGMSISFELLFDTTDSQGDVYAGHVQHIEKLVRIKPALKRPPVLVVQWAPKQQFRGVVESLSVRYTLFLTDGTPVRAIATVKMRAASAVSVRQELSDH